MTKNKTVVMMGRCGKIERKKERMKERKKEREKLKVAEERKTVNVAE